jgi:hypothetical protein
MVTAVVLDPATSVCGEKVTLAPAGKPLVENVTVAGQVLAFVGVKVRENNAVPPGCAVAEPPLLLDVGASVKSTANCVRTALVVATKFPSPP